MNTATTRIVNRPWSSLFRRQCSLGDRRSRFVRDRDEAGAILILALAYIVAVGMIVGAIADWAMNDLNNTTKFNSASELHYAVSSVTNVAIQSIRYAPLPSATPTQKQATALGNCWTPAAGSPVSQYEVDGYTVAVWCSTFEDLTLANTRTVSFYSCLSTLTSSSTSSDINSAMANCQANPVLSTVVIFDDYPAGGAPRLTVQCNLGVGQCGEGMTLNSWIWK